MNARGGKDFRALARRRDTKWLTQVDPRWARFDALIHDPKASVERRVQGIERRQLGRVAAVNAPFAVTVGLCLSGTFPRLEKPPTVATLTTLYPQTACGTICVMSNVRRLRTSDRIFFVTTNLRKDIAPLTAREFPVIIEAFERLRARLHFGLCGYVLMPDHWHALIWTAYPLTISEVVQQLKRVSALKINRERGTSGPLWQHQFWDRFVRNAKELSQRLDYMHHNPVRKGLVPGPGEWPWSSYNDFSLQESKPTGSPIAIDYVSLPESYRA